jgi:hypothetical protein
MRVHGMNFALFVLAASIIGAVSLGIADQVSENAGHGRVVSSATRSYLSDKRACEAIGGRWLRMTTNRGQHVTPVCIDRKAVIMGAE